MISSTDVVGFIESSSESQTHDSGRPDLYSLDLQLYLPHRLRRHLSLLAQHGQIAEHRVSNIECPHSHAPRTNEQEVPLSLPHLLSRSTAPSPESSTPA